MGDRTKGWRADCFRTRIAEFDAAYAKARGSSQPDDWMEAALLAQKFRNVIGTVTWETSSPALEQHVTPPDLARFEGASEETPVGGIQRLEQEAALENGWRTFDGLPKALSTGDGDVG